MRDSSSHFRPFGKDPLTGRIGEGGYRLVFFRGEPTLPITMDEILDREESVARAKISSESESDRRSMGIIKK